MTRLRKDQTEELLAALDSATSGPLEEITMIRVRLEVALRIVLDAPTDDWRELIHRAAELDSWDDERRTLLLAADTPDRALDAELLLWGLWDLVTELNERRSLG